MGVLEELISERDELRKKEKELTNEIKKERQKERAKAPVYHCLSCEKRIEQSAEIRREIARIKEIFVMSSLQSSPQTKASIAKRLDSSSQSIDRIVRLAVRKMEREIESDKEFEG